MNGQANNQSTQEFDEFQAAGEVEIAGGEVGTSEPKPATRRAPPKAPKAAAPATPAADDAGADGNPDDDEDDQSGNVNDQGADDDQDEDGNQRTPRESQIDRLKRERAAAQKEARELRRRLEAAEKGELSRRLEALEKGLQGGGSNVNPDAGKPAPDPTDTEKYPLGHLDDRYIEDKLEWLADKKAAEKADAVLQRQQENDQRNAAEKQAEELVEKVDALSTRGSEIYEDFHESVIEAGMRGDWDLTQTTFEAANDAENGVQILYELSQDVAEAKRVAKLSPYQQLQFVAKRDAEISQEKTPRRIPKAGEPPVNQARGANSRTQGNPSTDNLDDFEKQWVREAKH